MAWTFVGAGTATSRGGVNPITNLTVPLPAGAQFGDLLLLQLQTFGVAASPPVVSEISAAGEPWTTIAQITNGGGANRHRHFLAYTRHAGAINTSNPSVVFTGTGTTGTTGDSYVARTYAYRPGAGYEWLIDVIGTPSTNASTNAIGPATGITPTTLGAPLSTLIVGSFGKPNDINLTNLVTLAPTGYTANLVETITGSDAGAVFIHRLDAPQTATGNLTVPDNGNPQVGASILVSFKEDPLTVSGVVLRSFATIC